MPTCKLATWPWVAPPRKLASITCARQSPGLIRTATRYPRAQLELREPAIDIAATLDEYAALHELRARLAEREGDSVECTAALSLAHDCYSRFGMNVHAERVAAAQPLYLKPSPPSSLPRKI